MTYLVHHGVKGQKWGVTRTKAQLGTAVSKVGTAVKNVDKKAVAKSVGKVAIRSAVVAGASFVAGSAGIAAVGAVRGIAAANPEIVQAGEDFVATKLADFNIIDLSAGQRAGITARSLVRDTTDSKSLVDSLDGAFETTTIVR